MLDLKNVADNKEFWKTVKPFLSDKAATFPKIYLLEKGKQFQMNLKLPTHLGTSLKMLYIHLVSKQRNILKRIMI